MHALPRTILAAALLLAQAALAESTAECKNHYILSTCFPPAATEYLADIVKITAGQSHTCAMAYGGDAMCWGSNTYGQVGDGTAEDRAMPVAVLGLASSVTAVAAGDQHTCAIYGADATVACWGANEHGQLGDGARVSRSQPKRVAGLTGRMSLIAAGSAHTCAVGGANTVKCWGDNSMGQLGTGWTGPSVAEAVDVQGLDGMVVDLWAGGSQTCARLARGGVKCWGSLTGVVSPTCPSCDPFDGVSTPTPQEIDGLGGVTAMAAGATHACAIVSDRSVQCWGVNARGLGDGLSTSAIAPGVSVALGQPAVKIAASVDHTCAVLADGGVTCWGGNAAGQLGDGSHVDRSLPARVAKLPRMASAFAVGGMHSCIVETGGGVDCWGRNLEGQLGDGTKTGDDESGGRGTPGLVLAGAGVIEPLSNVTRGNKRYLLGTERRLSAKRDTLTSLVVLRKNLMPDGTAGELDPTWGEDGIARVPIWGDRDEARNIAFQPDGKVVVMGASLDPAASEDELRLGYLYEPHYYIGVARLDSDGSVDRTFNHNGRLVFRVGGIEDSLEWTVNQEASDLMVRLDGRIVIGGVAVIGPEGKIELVTALMYPSSSLPVIELHVALEFVNEHGQFLLTADADEALRLDRGRAEGWNRTGYAFHVFPTEDKSASTVPVCRFHGAAGGYFFSSDPEECAHLANDGSGAWALETADAFRVELADASGACAKGRTPVQRFNPPDAGGAPRYAASPVVAEGLARRGWTVQGRGPEQVAFCVP